MTAETARIGAAGGDGKAGDIVISIDAMGGDRGVAEVISGMGKSLEKNPRLRYILHGDGELLTRSIHKDSRLEARTEVRHAAGVVAMDDKPSKVAAQRPGHQHVERARGGEGRQIAGGDLLRQHRRADGARRCWRCARRPGVDRPAIAVLWPSLNPAGYNILLDAGADIRADADDLAEIRGDGRLLRPQRARAEAAAGRPAQRRHRGAQGPLRTARGGAAHRRDRARPATSSTSATSRAATCRPTGSTSSSPTASPATSR